MLAPVAGSLTDGYGYLVDPEASEISLPVHTISCFWNARGSVALLKLFTWHCWFSCTGDILHMRNHFVWLCDVIPGQEIDFAPFVATFRPRGNSVGEKREGSGRCSNWSRRRCFAVKSFEKSVNKYPGIWGMHTCSNCKCFKINTLSLRLA